MKVCYKNGKVNLNYHTIYGEEKAINDGYILCNIPNDIKDFCSYDFDDNGFNHEKYQNRKNNSLLKNEVFSLEKWFNEFFEMQLIQSLWQSNFKVTKDIYFKDENGEFKTYSNIEELKTQGEIVRQRIKEIRDLLKD